MANPTKQQFIYSRILIALVVLLLVGTLVAENIGGPVVYVVMTVVIGFAVWASSRKRWLTFGILALGLANVGTSIWISVWPEPHVLSLVMSRSFGVAFVAAVGLGPAANNYLLFVLGFPG